MSEDSVLQVYGYGFCVVALIGVVRASMVGDDVEDGIMGGVMAILIAMAWPLAAGFAPLYLLGRWLRNVRLHRIEVTRASAMNRLTREEQIERDYQEVQRLINS
jgi:hypothetical protein